MPLLRTKKLTVRFTQKEYVALKEKAELAGYKMEPFLRALAAGCEIKARPPQEYGELVRQISAVGNNLNQIARLANGNKEISPVQMQEVLRLQREIWQMVRGAQ